MIVSDDASADKTMRKAYTAGIWSLEKPMIRSTRMQSCILQEIEKHMQSKADNAILSKKTKNDTGEEQQSVQ